MSNNVRLIYSLIEQDLKREGWDSTSIAKALAECQKERQITGADDNTICVKELSYLSKESVQKIAAKMDNQKSSTNMFNRFKNGIINIAINYWHQNIEVKIGLLFLFPPTLGVFIFILNFIGADIIFGDSPGSWDWGYEVSNRSILSYLGLMAIAGAYLIKGNLKKK